MSEDSIIKVWINNKSFNINVEHGLQDVGWLCITACHLYGKSDYPIARYIPTLAENSKNELLHPKLVICKYRKIIGNEIFVVVQSSSLEFQQLKSEKHITWYKQAFEKEKYLSEYRFRFYPSTQDYKYNIKIFNLKVKFDIYPPIAHFSEYRTDEILEIQLPLSQTQNDMHEKIMTLPYGKINVQKVYFKESEDSIKEINDFTKNKLLIDIFPEQLHDSEKEEFLRNKEIDILKKESELKLMIREIEKEKQQEEEKKKMLEEFLNSIPFSLDDIYDMTVSVITNSEAEIDPIFYIFYKNEFEYFKTIYTMFENYSLYTDEKYEYGEFVTVNVLKHMFVTFFNKAKANEYESLNNAFKYYYLDRKSNSKFFRFDEFMFCLIYCLYYNNNINSIELIPYHLDYFFSYYNTKINQEAFSLLFFNKDIIMLIKDNFHFFNILFNKEAKESPLMDYKEIKPNEIKSIFVQAESILKNTNFIDFLKEIKYDKGINFFTFLELCILIALNMMTPSEIKNSKKNKSAPDTKKGKNEEELKEENSDENLTIYNQPTYKLNTLIKILKETFPNYAKEAEVLKQEANKLLKTKSKSELVKKMTNSVKSMGMSIYSSNSKGSKFSMGSKKSKFEESMSKFKGTDSKGFNKFKSKDNVYENEENEDNNEHHGQEEYENNERGEIDFHESMNHTNSNFRMTGNTYKSYLSMEEVKEDDEY